MLAVCWEPSRSFPTSLPTPSSTGLRHLTLPPLTRLTVRLGNAACLVLISNSRETATTPDLTLLRSHAGLTDCCRDCANSLLQFLNYLKLQDSLPRADSTPVRYSVQRLHALGQVREIPSFVHWNFCPAKFPFCKSGNSKFTFAKNEFIQKHKHATAAVHTTPTVCSIANCAIAVQDLRPRGQDVLKEELGYMVDKEMIATSTAIEEAVLRMDVRIRSYTSHHHLSHTPSWITLTVHILNRFCFLLSLRRRSWANLRRRPTASSWRSTRGNQALW